jgi:hypothetical protein
MTHTRVKAILTCPEVPPHVLGAVGRQVVAVSGSPAGRESVHDVWGLRRVDGPDGEDKLVGGCRACHANGSKRSPEWGWARVRLLLDEAQRTESGILTVPMLG